MSAQFNNSEVTESKTGKTIQLSLIIVLITIAVGITAYIIATNVFQYNTFSEVPVKNATTTQSILTPTPNNSIVKNERQNEEFGSPSSTRSPDSEEPDVIYQTKNDCELKSGDKCLPLGSVKIRGVVTENKSEVEDGLTERYLSVKTKDGIVRRIMYYHSTKFEACVIPDSEPAISIKPQQSIEAIGMATNESATEITICNSNDYSLHTISNPE